MKNFSLPVQLFKLLISLILSICIMSIVFSSIFVEEEPIYASAIEMACAIIFAVVVVIVYDYNEICKERSLISKTKQDVISSIDVRKKLIEKAEKVVDKYTQEETEIYGKFAESRGNEKRAKVSIRNITEAYPQLKSNEAVQKLLNQLESIERLILDSKKQYTTAVADYNASIHTFPVVLVKPIFKWQNENAEVVFEDEIVSDEELGI